MTIILHICSFQEKLEMIFNTWEEINSRFDEVKKLKPRTPQTLNEIVEVLVSTYKLHKNKASGMWQSIIDLNTQDDVTYADFYVVQVFHKFQDVLGMKESAHFLLMNGKRRKLFYEYGFSEDSMIVDAYAIIGYRLSRGRRGSVALRIVKFLKEKYKMNSDKEIYSFYSILYEICRRLEEHQNQVDNEFRYNILESDLEYFYKFCYMEIEDDEEMRAFFNAKRCIYKETRNSIHEIMKTKKSLTKIAAHTNKYLLCLAIQYMHYAVYREYGNNIFNKQVEDFWVDYFTEAERIYLPDDLIEAEGCELSAVQYGTNSTVIRLSYPIHKILFSKYWCKKIIIDILHYYMDKSYWNTFDELLILGLNQQNKYYSETYAVFLGSEIDDLLENDQRMGWSKEKLHGFTKSLLFIRLFAKNCYYYEELSKKVDNFVNQEIGEEYW